MSKSATGAAVGIALVAMLASGNTPALVAQVPNPSGPSDPARVVTEIDSDLDGHPNQVATRSLTYDRRRVVQFRIETDGTPNPAAPESDGVVDRVEVGERMYDARGAVVMQIVDIDLDPQVDPDNFEERRVNSLAYDDAGNRVMEVVTRYLLDTNEKFETIVLNTFDQRGNLLTRAVTVESPNPDGRRREFQTNIYDRQGDRIEATTQTDRASDGDVDREVTTTVEREPDGRPRVARTTIDDPFGGGIDEIRMESGFAFHGNVVQQVVTTRDIAPFDPPSPLWVGLVTNTFEQGDRLTEHRVAFDLDGDGEFDDSVLVTARSFDDSGNLLMSVSDGDQNADGIRDRIVREIFTY